MRLTEGLLEQVYFFAEELEQGRIENAMTMVLASPAYYPALPILLQDERFRIRTGVVLILHELQELAKAGLAELADLFLPLLRHTDARIRAEAASAIEIIGVERHLEPLKGLLQDPQRQVAELALEAIEEIQGRL